MQQYSKVTRKRAWSVITRPPLTGSNTCLKTISSTETNMITFGKWVIQALAVRVRRSTSTSVLQKSVPRFQDATWWTTIIPRLSKSGILYSCNTTAKPTALLSRFRRKWSIPVWDSNACAWLCRVKHPITTRTYSSRWLKQSPKWPERNMAKMNRTTLPCVLLPTTSVPLRSQLLTDNCLRMPRPVTWFVVSCVVPFVTDIHSLDRNRHLCTNYFRFWLTAWEMPIRNWLLKKSWSKRLSKKKKNHSSVLWKPVSACSIKQWLTPKLTERLKSAVKTLSHYMIHSVSHSTWQSWFCVKMVWQSMSKSSMPKCNSRNNVPAMQLP